MAVDIWDASVRFFSGPRPTVYLLECLLREVFFMRSAVLLTPLYLFWLPLTVSGQEDKTLPILVQQLKDKDAETRARAARGLGSLGAEAKSAVPALVEALKDDNFDVRSYTIDALGRIGPEAKAAVPAMLALLKDKDGK